LLHSTALSGANTTYKAYLDLFEIYEARSASEKALYIIM
jgi:hypothetical protein